jgi:hypothetical protein
MRQSLSDAEPVSRRRCDSCLERDWLDPFVPLIRVSEAVREFYRDLLEQEGIPAVLKTTPLARFGSAPSIDLWVRRRDAEAARQVVAPATFPG